MKTKHTSGPWFIMGGDGFGNIQISGAPFDSEHNDPLWHAVTTGPTDEERNANAALICAAPELLAALEELLPLLTGTRFDGYRQNVSCIIKKAKGYYA